MGYQVGNNCYATRQDAENVYFSLVPPKIGDDGKLYQAAPYYTAAQLRAAVGWCAVVDPLDYRLPVFVLVLSWVARS